MTRTFALYPEERHWWSFNDYGHVLDTVRALGAKRILEFGPGSSTLALIEGGATHIDTCEDQADWAEVYEDRLQGKYPSIVHVRRFVNADPLSIPAIDDERYDLALIDGPLGTQQRGPAIRYSMARCTAVLVPTEDRNRYFRGEIAAIAEAAGWEMAVTDTGPLSGGFALLTPKAHTVEEEPAGEPDEAPPSVLPEEIDHQDPPPLVTRPAAPASRRARRRAAKKTAP
jgi:hypothetical protein